jgi:hypothetical protein
MKENRRPVTVGKPANLARERAFAESIALLKGLSPAMLHHSVANLP